MSEVVITGVGVVSPIGIGKDPFWDALVEGQSGVGNLEPLDDSRLACSLGAEVGELNAKKFVKPRKNIKVMSRDIQIGFVAAHLAREDAAMQADATDPERTGVIFGADLIALELPELQDAFAVCLVDGKFDFDRWGSRAMSAMYPLWMLKYLPNMPACHIGIANDFRGPNNSHILAEVSSLSAIAEAVRVIERGQADVMLAGGTSSALNPTVWGRSSAYPLSHRIDDPKAAVRPFDADRDGMVYGEGAATFVLESRAHADARGAKILGRIAGFAARFEPHRTGQALTGGAITTAIQGALASADMRPSDIGHVNAHGLGTVEDDPLEARAIRETLGDVPVTAPKSYFGNLAAGTGAVELAVSLLAIERGVIPPTLNYERPDPACPLNVIHGQAAPLGIPTAITLNQTPVGQSVAMVVTAE